MGKWRSLPGGTESGNALSENISSSVFNFFYAPLVKDFSIREKNFLGCSRIAFGPDRNLRKSRWRQSWAGINASLPVLLLLCFFHAVDEALPPRIFLPPPIPLLLTFELWTERWETWACLPGRLTKAAAATALCSWEEEEKEWGTPLTPIDEMPRDR